MRIAIGSDHRGFSIRPKVIEWIREMGHEVIDVGSHTPEPVDYPDIAAAVGRLVISAEVDSGILICGTGFGMSIAANKMRGIRAAACHDDLTAELSRRHNDANILCLSAELLGERLMQRMLRIWLETPFEGGRHARRLRKIANLEAVLQARPVEGETVDSKLHPFCDAMCTLAERDFIYSGIARIYRQAARAMEDFDDEDVPGMTTDSDDEGYGSMEDMPEDM